eukprot:gnl/MRDRNA2_/MRDRNA2_76820_c0_seq1.p1 gnl/MRDRNA2_/MRDRNA2_76820_c0~~gnl/MRDRNA2_/MRDRNA2_76820_c0_seq1.p1  ORF type:complete len:442 (-),score=71.96 gnl/MRDRNA2_/MRDRNA2_76820_c0_seq1:60-1385(-)
MALLQHAGQASRDDEGTMPVASTTLPEPASGGPSGASIPPPPMISSMAPPPSPPAPERSLPQPSSLGQSSGGFATTTMGSLGPMTQSTVPPPKMSMMPPPTVSTLPPPPSGTAPQPIEEMWAQMGSMGPPQSLPPPTVTSLAPPPPEKPTVEQQLQPPPPPQKLDHHGKHIPLLDPPPFPSVPMPDVEGLGKSLKLAIEPSTLKSYTSFCFLACTIVYYMPIVTCICWGQDTDVVYWLGYGWVAAIALPFIWLLIFAVQNGGRFKQPRKFIMVFAMLLGCVMFAGIGGDYYGGARLAATKLISSDCSDFFPEKKQLHIAYEAASKIYTACQNDKTVTYWVNTVEDCPGYTESSPHWRQWQYLKSVEARFGCAGFCQERAGTGLWYPSLQTQDPCDEAIGRKMQAIQKQALGMLSYACIAFFCFMIWGFMVFPSLKQYIGLK